MTNAPISFRDLLHLAFPESAMRWIAGESFAAHAVHWVVTVVEEISQGDILLLPSHELNIQEVWIAQQRGAAGVILLGPQPSTTNGLAAGLPIVVLDSEENLRAVQRLLLILLINQRAGLVERGYRIHLQLAQLSAEGAGLGGLVKAMVDISGKGVLVQDKRGYVLAEQSSAVLLGIWQDVLVQLSTLNTLPELLRDRKVAGKKNSPLLQEIPGGLVRLIVPITVGEVARGYLSLVGLSIEMDELDHMVAEQGVVVCAIEMARSKAVREMEKRLQGDLLIALLHDEFSPRDAGLWAQTMGLDLNQAHAALRFAWGEPDSPSRRRLETLIHGEVTRLGLKVIISAMGPEVICFCEVQPDANRPDPALELGQRVLDQGKEEYPAASTLCGIGTSAQDLSEWHTSFRQAGQALEMARRLGADKPLYFPDLSIYRLLFQIEHNPELLAFQEETLGPLLAQDNGQELLSTLESYFAHNGNISQSAAALFVHRNTLIYRLQRIATILNQDLEKPEMRLALQLALHIYRMSGSRL